MTAYELTGPILADEDRTVGKAWVVGGRMTYERPRHTDVTRVDGWVIPGLVDMHCHLSVGPSGPVDGDLVLKQAIIERDAGVLMVRDTGSASSLDVLDGRRDVPKVYRSGRFIARPKRYLKGYAVEVEPDELASEAARQAKASGSWVKIIADWIDRDLGERADLAPLWSVQQWSDAVAAAHREGARVTAHTFATESLDALLDARLDCIEHGTGMTDVHMERAAAAGIPVVPTLLQIANFASFAAQAAERFPIFAARMQRMYDRRYEQVAQMREAGVTLLTGTDAGTSIAHGDLAREAREMATCLPAADVVAGATWRARKFLGAPVLEEGAPADLVVLIEDPRRTIDTLGSPAMVMLEGLAII